MSDSQVHSQFDRRPSFWKTPITHSPSVTGQKRNYSEINNSERNAAINPHKKRRLLTDLEIQNIAKNGGFNPSNIIIAVLESDGFKWFKRTPNSQLPQMPNIKHKYLQKYWPNKIETEIVKNVLREISKDELKQKSKHRKAAKPNNPNELNRAQAIALQKVAKKRRYTAPITILQQEHNSNTHKPRKRKKKTRTIVQYKTKKEIIKKKVKRKRRVVYKKKTRTLTQKIITEFSDISIPSFPVPNLKLNVLFFCDVNKPYIAIENFESSLIDSFVIPLTNTYGTSADPFGFITRTILQFLMEIKNNLNTIVHCMDWTVQSVNVHQSILKYKEIISKNNKTNPNSKSQSLSQSLAPFEDGQCLSDECRFYERELAVINAFCDDLKHEIDFTKHVQRQLKSETYLKGIFGFDLGHSNSHNLMNANIVLSDNEFMYKMASEIDEIYNEYCIDFMKIECEQRIFENELNIKEERISELKRFYGKDLDLGNTKIMGNAKGNVRDKLIFANFIEANQCNNVSEDEMNNENNNICYLRNLNGYQMRENDTLQMLVCAY